MNDYNEKEMIQGHDVHAVQEERQTAQQGNDGKNIHRFRLLIAAP